AIFLAISYIGLVAAAASEIVTRIPGLEASFGAAVGLTSALVIGVGMVLLARTLGRSMRRMPAHWQKGVD
ncbi:MAG: hypothetical protein KDD91_03525, partial [Caldilinea sp.]|nr:hypothetical protein [Caldilinea sp.]